MIQLITTRSHRNKLTNQDTREEEEEEGRKVVEETMPTITKLYSMEEAAEHNTREDCWIVIDGKVYDVSTYLDEHPGGYDVLLEVTGKDATEEFEDAGHSNDARVLMEEYCIGELDSPPVPAPKIMSKEDLDNFPLKVLNLSKHYWYIPVAAIGLSVAVGILLRRRN